nr:MAG TPA: hypothetical protein [Caudoviricetes sp.]
MVQTKTACDLKKGAGLFPLLSLFLFNSQLCKSQD